MLSFARKTTLLWLGGVLLLGSVRTPAEAGAPTREDDGSAKKLPLAESPTNHSHRGLRARTGGKKFSPHLDPSDEAAPAREATAVSKNAKRAPGQEGPVALADTLAPESPAGQKRTSAPRSPALSTKGPVQPKRASFAQGPPLEKPTFAQAGDDGREKEPVARIVVTAEPVEEASQRAPTAFVSVLETQKRAEEGETVVDALAEAVGVQVRRFGGLGAFSTLSVRGSSANQVQIYFDGVPLSRARNETVDLSDLPIDSLERIEVYRGVAPLSFGTQALGGVVNLVPRKPGPEPTTEVAAQGGSFGTRKVTGFHSRRLGRTEVLGHVSYLGSEGDFSFLDDNGTPLQPADDEVVERKNNAFDSVDALLRVGVPWRKEVRADLVQEVFFKDQGVPGVGNTQSDTASFREFRSLSYLRTRSRGWLWSPLDLEATVFGSFQREEFQDREEDLKLGPQDRDDRSVFVGGNLLGVVYALSGHVFSVFLGLAHERFDGENRIPEDGDEPTQTRLRFSAGLQDEWTLFRERLLLVPSLRFERIRDRIGERLPVGQVVGEPVSVGRTLWNPALGARLEVFPWLALRGNLGLFERAPNFTELFGTREAVSGNEKLRSERAFNRDVGFTVEHDFEGIVENLRLEYAYFDNDFDDIIVLVPVNRARFKPLNVGGARIRGHEFSLSASFRELFRLDLNYTRQDAENRGADPTTRGRRLPLRPRDELYARFEVSGSRWEAHYELSFVGGNFRDPVNFDRVPDRDIHTVGASFSPWPWIRFSLEARNVTDNQVQDVAGFPLPGLSLFGTVKIRP
ncbi:MAG: TonB-dependent receptor [Candidatus Binatia bacterium]|nr:MAG: TonB-dependent receptor [Candidatus Binatia bacterium]